MDWVLFGVKELVLILLGVKTTQWLHRENKVLVSYRCIVNSG